MEQIRVGASVFDRTGKEVGAVKTVQFGDDNAHTARAEAVAPPELPQQHPFLDAIAAVLAPTPTLPDPIRERIIRTGYVHVERNPVQGDAFIVADQIAGVSDSEVHLSVDEDDLIRKS